MADETGHGSDAVSDAVRQVVVAMDRYSDAVGAISGAHRTHLGALSVIMDASARGEDVTAGRLGAALGLGSAATTALLDRLERAGHVQRVRSTVDRRQVQVRITDDALELGERMYAPLDAAITAHLEGFSAEELRIARRVLDAVLTGATEAVERLGSADPLLDPSD